MDKLNSILELNVDELVEQILNNKNDSTGRKEESLLIAQVMIKLMDKINNLTKELHRASESSSKYAKGLNRLTAILIIIALLSIIINLL